MAERIAVITGAGQGAGQSIAEKLAAGGVHVVLAGRTASKVENVAAKIGSLATPYHVDVTDSKAVNQLASDVEKQFGHVDMLINSAGEAFIRPMIESADEDWDRIVNINLKGPFLTARAFLPLLRKSENASIINILSKVALGSYGGVSIYSAAKTGLLGFSRSLAMELQPENIRVVPMCPGAMDTPMRWAATPVFDRKDLIQPDTVAEMVWHIVNLPQGITIGEVLLQAIHYM